MLDAKRKAMEPVDIEAELRAIEGKSHGKSRPSIMPIGRTAMPRELRTITRGERRPLSISASRVKYTRWDLPQLSLSELHFPELGRSYVGNPG